MDGDSARPSMMNLNLVPKCNLVTRTEKCMLPQSLALSEERSVLRFQARARHRAAATEERSSSFAELVAVMF